MDELQLLGARLFQKDPKVVKELKKICEREQNPSEAASKTRHFIFTTVQKVIEKKLAWSTQLPSRLENYISYCDVFTVTYRSMDKVWYTFQLKDYQSNIHDEDHDECVPILKIRRTLKKKLQRINDNLAVSVQVELRLTNEENESEKDEIMFVRIASVSNNNGRRPEKVEANLCKKVPHFFVYFPGEPYIYADSKNPDKDHLQAWAATLHCSGYSPLPLFGQNVEALRKLRKRKDENDNLESDDGGSMDHSGDLADEDDPPEIESFSVKAFDGNGEEDIGLKFRGDNVLKGLAALQEHGVFPGEIPLWLKKAGRCGLNSIRVDENGRDFHPMPVTEDEEMTEDFDAGTEDASSAQS